MPIKPITFLLYLFPFLVLGQVKITTEDNMSLALIQSHDQVVYKGFLIDITTDSLSIFDPRNVKSKTSIALEDIDRILIKKQLGFWSNSKKKLILTEASLLAAFALQEQKFQSNANNFLLFGNLFYVIPINAIAGLSNINPSFLYESKDSSEIVNLHTIIGRLINPAAKSPNTNYNLLRKIDKLKFSNDHIPSNRSLGYYPRVFVQPLSVGFVKSSFTREILKINSNNFDEIIEEPNQFNYSLGIYKGLSRHLEIGYELSRNFSYDQIIFESFNFQYHNIATLEFFWAMDDINLSYKFSPFCYGATNKLQTTVGSGYSYLRTYQRGFMLLSSINTNYSDNQEVSKNLSGMNLFADLDYILSRNISIQLRYYFKKYWNFNSTNLDLTPYGGMEIKEVSFAPSIAGISISLIVQY